MALRVDCNWKLDPRVMVWEVLGPSGTEVLGEVLKTLVDVLRWDREI